MGPTGPAGNSGVAGAQGVAGVTGVRGSTSSGSVGAMGRSGPTGAQGSVGAIGMQGPAGVVDRWTSVREVMFEYERSDILPSETGKVSEVASYMRQNPSLQVGIDGSMDPRGSDPRDQNLTDRRVDAVRTALIKAGVPAGRIKTGAFGDTSLAKDRRVELLVISSK